MSLYKITGPTTYLYTGSIALLPTAWDQFKQSGFKQRPARKSFKTNKARWSKQ